MENYILILLFLFSVFFISESTKGNYSLIIATYRQEPGGRPEVSGITSPFLNSIPIKDLETCNKGGEITIKEIYKPVCNLIVNGIVYLAEVKNKVIF